MATKKTAVIPEEEILAAATDENINEHALHQTETEPEPDRVLSAEGAPGDADLIDICQTRQRLFSRPRRLRHTQRLRSGRTRRPYPQNAELCTAPRNRRASFELNALTKKLTFNFSDVVMLKDS